MIDRSRVLQIAQRNAASQGYVDYKDFIALRPQDEPGGHWLRPVKKILLDEGYTCHEARFKSKWWGICSYTQGRTHFHYHKKIQGCSTS